VLSITYGKKRLFFKILLDKLFFINHSYAKFHIY
jgi:hypothetical protein